MIRKSIRKLRAGVFGYVSRLLSSIDSGSRIHPNARINRFVKVRDSSIGRYSYVGSQSRVVNADVGSFCSISWDCMIGVESHPSNLISTSPIFFERYNGTGSSWLHEDIAFEPTPRTSIGSDVWIGAGSIVLAGVSVGHGAVIGAGSIVTKDVLPYAVVAGVPARQLRLRFSEDVIRKLIEKKWWEASDAALRDSIDLFATRNPSVREIEKLPALHLPNQEN